MSANTLVQIESRLKALGFTKSSSDGKRAYTFLGIGSVPIIARFSVTFNKNTYTISGSIVENDKESSYASIYEKSITVDAKYFDGSASTVSSRIIALCHIFANEAWANDIWRGFWYKVADKPVLILTQNIIGSRVRYYPGGGGPKNPSTLHLGSVNTFANVDDKIRIYVEDSADSFYDRDVRHRRQRIRSVDLDDMQFEKPLPLIDGSKLTYPKQQYWIRKG